MKQLKIGKKIMDGSIEVKKWEKSGNAKEENAPFCCNFVFIEINGFLML
ncbi:hypothetical protein ACFL38_02900 [Candidatus Omnitrophota bacterium]